MKVLYGPARFRLFKWVCGKCIYANMGKVRAWLSELEEEFK